MTKVLLPQPDSPTSATDSPGLMTRFNPRRTKSYLRVGYRNQTFFSSIFPITPSVDFPIFYSSISRALIVEGYSNISKTFLTAPRALPKSAPVAKAAPA